MLSLQKKMIAARLSKSINLIQSWTTLFVQKNNKKIEQKQACMYLRC